MPDSDASPTGEPLGAELDPALAARAAAGDEAAFEALVLRWQGRVAGLARRFFRRPEDVEEIAQEVFLKMHRSIGEYRGQAPFQHWLLRVATNTCRDRLRARRRRPEEILSEVTDDAQRWLDAALEGRALEAAQAETARVLATDLLDALPEKDRIVLVLMDLEGKPAAEVASLTGSTRGAVKIRAMRARRALRRLAIRVETGPADRRRSPDGGSERRGTEGGGGR
jgi:RNA polymerase sigma-70 factor (ECF subfamily)